MDRALEHHQSYIGRPVAELPSPSLVLSLPILKRNTEALLQDVEDLEIAFRPHVKTLKTLEMTRLMLAGGKFRSIVASTVTEIKGCLPLVSEGILDECVYGFPVYPSVLPELVQLRQHLEIILIIDNEQQIDLLEKADHGKRWEIFIKLDVGARRAGVDPSSPVLDRLIQRANASPAMSIYGFYCHANHSYGGRTRREAEDMLKIEIDSLLGAAELLPSDRKVVLSLGATPTAHVIKSLKAKAPENVQIELHAGNFPCNDLQQVSTGVVTEQDQAGRVIADVCSLYEERNEALVNAGVTSLSRETSPAYPGFGRIASYPKWGITRMSQEHGILGLMTDDKSTERAEVTFKVGQRLHIYCNHICITAAAFQVYFIVDENDIVQETWIPWKGW
ncbi:unnamed protein product [Clonostachys rhizophaga]|uniref:D-serine dehydratase n=1 Tax=Clonostachys rhizophaga TaxID=160324 RepID=A0A9N9YKD1_9HYPO|nr:unnamed protein product [Clonostachys rhizophaga]